jgi:peroxiredoxin
MALTPSTMLPLGTKIPAFALPDTAGKIVTDSDFTQGPRFAGLLVVFLCNHCPYVKHIRSGLAQMTREYMKKGISVVGIMANDVVNYPDDRPELMVKEKAEAGYDFPYLYDESQAVAKAYQAACTPDFFLFDQSQKLVYRGQMDDSRPGNGKPVSGTDLRAAMDAVLEMKPVIGEQKPAIGCNIKWRRGSEPSYFGAR